MQVLSTCVRLPLHGLSFHLFFFWFWSNGKYLRQLDHEYPANSVQECMECIYIWRECIYIHTVPLYQMLFRKGCSVLAVAPTSLCVHIWRECIYIHMYMHMYICTCICKNVHAYVHMYIYMYICTYTYMHTCICTYVCTYIYMYMYTYRYMYMYIYIRTWKVVHIHKYILNLSLYIHR